MGKWRTFDRKQSRIKAEGGGCDRQIGAVDATMT